MDFVKHSGYYFDTSIWLDLFEKRGINGEFAFELVKELIKSNLSIYFSDAVIQELKQLNYSDNDISSIFGLVWPKKLKKVHIFDDELIEARDLSILRDIPKRDCIHAILARDNNLQLITRDKDFDKLKEVTKTLFPEEAVFFL